jgi:drug/metabolite transporter (DMT)-like permease
VLILSGLLAIGLGHSLFYRAIPVLGVSVSTSIGLLTPLLSSLISYVVFGDVLSVIQLAGAAGLLSGCFLIIRARFREDSERKAARLSVKD